MPDYVLNVRPCVGGVMAVSGLRVEVLRVFGAAPKGEKLGKLRGDGRHSRKAPVLLGVDVNARPLHTKPYTNPQSPIHPQSPQDPKPWV